jgi:pimeloyl-ACP methyl ester carboxylesterase
MTIMHIPASEGSPKLCVDDGGSGRLPVIFVHSLGGTHAHWSAQLKELRIKRRALALDLRGHGCSAMPEDGDYSIKSLSTDIDSLVTHLDLHRYVLVGHSLGGSVAIAHAGAHPNRVAGLLLVDPSGDARQVPVEQMAQFMTSLESESYRQAMEEYYNGILAGSQPAVRERVLADLFATPRETMIAIFKALTEFDPLPSLRNFFGPKLSVITPFNDAPFSLHKLEPSLPHILVPDTSHWLQMDRPEEFNRILDEFLRSVEQSENQEAN